MTIFTEAAEEGDRKRPRVMVTACEIIHPPFRIVYRLDANKIRIVRVRRSERLLKIE